MDTVEEQTTFFDSCNLEKGPCLGKGGSGEVFLASSKDDVSKKFAVKTIKLERADGTSRLDHFRSEVSFMRNLRHPRVVSLRAFGYNPQHGYILMKHYPRGCLDDIVESVEPPHALGYILDVGSALEHMHQRFFWITTVVQFWEILAWQDN